MAIENIGALAQLSHTRDRELEANRRAHGYKHIAAKALRELEDLKPKALANASSSIAYARAAHEVCRKELLLVEQLQRDGDFKGARRHLDAAKQLRCFADECLSISVKLIAHSKPATARRKT